jgi:hypothetical protein
MRIKTLAEIDDNFHIYTEAGLGMAIGLGDCAIHFGVESFLEDGPEQNRGPSRGSFVRRRYSALVSPELVEADCFAIHPPELAMPAWRVNGRYVLNGGLRETRY